MMLKNYTKDDIIQNFKELHKCYRDMLRVNDYEMEMVYIVEESEINVLYFLDFLGVLSAEEFWELEALIYSNRKERY